MGYSSDKRNPLIKFRISRTCIRNESKAIKRHICGKKFSSIYNSLVLIKMSGRFKDMCLYKYTVAYCPLWRSATELTGAYLRKIAPMASTTIAFYIYYLLIISPGIHVYVYYMVFAKLLQENYLKNLFMTFPCGNIRC